MRFFAFTKKAIRSTGNDPFAFNVRFNRIFLVDDRPESKADKEGYLAAWKIDINGETLTSALFDIKNSRTGIFKSVPALSKNLTRAYLKRCVRRAYQNGSEPTAVIKLDSFYRQLTFKEVRTMISEK